MSFFSKSLGVLATAGLLTIGSLSNSYSQSTRHYSYSDSSLTDYFTEKYTLAHEIIDSQKRAFARNLPDYESSVIRKNAEKAKLMLDSIIVESAAKAKSSGLEPYDRTKNYSNEELVHYLDAISETLDEFGFYYSFSSSLITSLNTRKLDCTEYSFIFKGVAEASGYPLELVSVPEHIFTRWVKSDGSYFNYDPTSAQEVSDEDYIRSFRISEKAIERGTYMTSLSNSSIYALSYGDIADYISARFVDSFSSLKKELESVDHYMHTALMNDSKFVPGHVFKGYKYLFNGEFEKSKHRFMKLRNLDPNNVWAYLGAGMNYFALNDFNSSKKESDSALDLKSSSTFAYLLKGLSLDNIDSVDLARENYILAVDKGSSDISSFDFELYILNNADIKDSKNKHSVVENLIIDNFSKAILQDSLDFESYAYRGYYKYKLTGDFKGALKDVSKSIELNNSNPDAFAFKADIIFSRYSSFSDDMPDKYVDISIADLVGKDNVETIVLSSGKRQSISSIRSKMIREADKLFSFKGLLNNSLSLDSSNYVANLTSARIDFENKCISSSIKHYDISFNQKVDRDVFSEYYYAKRVSKNVRRKQIKLWDELFLSSYPLVDFDENGLVSSNEFLMAYDSMGVPVTVNLDSLVFDSLDMFGSIKDIPMPPLEKLVFLKKSLTAKSKSDKNSVSVFGKLSEED